MEKIVQCYDAQTGKYTGQTGAQLSPLDRGDVYLIPDCATELPVPDTNEGESAYFIGGAWVVQKDPLPAAEQASATAA